MSRYADIEPTIKKIKYSMEIGEIRGRIWFEMVLADLEKLPTIDAVPVVHGHWYVYETGYEDTEAKCSICGFETLVNEPGNGLHMVGDLKYCPQCGAKMDEVTE